MNCRKTLSIEKSMLPITLPLSKFFAKNLP